MRGKKLLVDNPASAIKDWQIELRQALFNAITPEDVEAIAKGLVDKAKGGDQGAIKLVFTHILGGGGISIRQGVVMMPEEARPAEGLSAQDLRETSPATMRLPEPAGSKESWMIVGISPDGERVMLAQEHDQHKAETKLEIMRDHLKGYREIVLERMAG